MKTQIKLAAVLTLVLILPHGIVSYAQEAASDTAAIRAQITANGRAVGRAIGTMDFAALEKVWSPDMVVNSPGNNILTRDQVFAAMREDKLKYSSARQSPRPFLLSRMSPSRWATTTLSCRTAPWRGNRSRGASQMSGRRLATSGSRLPGKRPT